MQNVIMLIIADKDTHMAWTIFVIGKENVFIKNKRKKNDLSLKCGLSYVYEYDRLFRTL